MALPQETNNYMRRNGIQCHTFHCRRGKRHFSPFNLISHPALKEKEHRFLIVLDGYAVEGVCRKAGKDAFHGSNDPAQVRRDSDVS